MALSWLCYGSFVAAAMAAASERREAVLWLPCQPGENKRVCSSYGSCIFLQVPHSHLTYLDSTNSAHSVNRKTGGTVRGISGTI